VHSKFHNVIRGVHSKYEEGCAFKISVGVFIPNMSRGVHSNYQQGCAFKISAGVGIGGCELQGGVHLITMHTPHNAHTPLAMHTPHNTHPPS